MSIRRKSCDPCFAARRKCDLTYPICERCRRNNKKCHYVYPPQLPKDDDVVDVVETNAVKSATEAVSSNWIHEQLGYGNNGSDYQFRSDHSLNLQLEQLRHPSVPKLLGPLGELRPMSSTKNEGWVLQQIREYPLDFAMQSETVFIHKALYPNSFPQPLLAAFGICAGSVSMNERNRPILFQAVDAEILKLLIPASTSTLLEDLVTLQAAVLYQIIRLYHGGLEQQIAAEQQEFLVRSYGLKLLQRADTELQTIQWTWETWILAESIRRTVLIAFKLYTIYAQFRYGMCTEIAAMGILPVSTKLGSWNSREEYLRHPDQDETIPYSIFKPTRVTVGRGGSEPFETLLLMRCQESIAPKP
ncbi:Fc.00g072490.m01.CDS01 [Cosmosporella sp. VM-42]